VRTSAGSLQGPGPNIFSDSSQNVFVDPNGDLHLKIIQGADGKWTASEIDMTQSLGCGTYEWEVSSRYDQFAKNAVGGLFTYLDPASVARQTGGVIGNGIADTPHEIDVEFTGAWGTGNLYFTTQDPDVQAPSKNLYQALTGDFTTHRFVWKVNSIDWASYNGHVAGVVDPPNPIVEQRSGPNLGKPATFHYVGPVVPRDLNEIPIINFWLSGDNVATAGPTNGQGQELIIHSFKYTPLPGDYNGDGKVDSADYQQWRSSFGSTIALAADANHNGIVDAADYVAWRSITIAGDLGGAANTSASNVPEPALVSMISWLTTLWWDWRR
jgi:hypothetical protein